MQTPKYEEIDNKFGFLVFRDYPGTTAQTATNYGYIFTAPFPFEILSAVEKHEVAGTTVGACILDVMKVANGASITTGVSILATSFDLKSTARTAVLKSGIGLNANRSFKALDSIVLTPLGVLTSVEGVNVTLYIKPLNMGEFRNYQQL